MVCIKHVFAYGVLGMLLACSQDGSIKTENADRPSNFKLTAQGSEARGQLLEATHVISLSQQDLDRRFAAFSIKARNGVHIYKVNYLTETPELEPQPIMASGIIVIPDLKQAVYPWVSVQHGTIAGKVDAPSVTPSEGIVEASQGFVSVAMDYLGFGSSSEIFHPYMIEEAYADAGVDMLRAAKTFASQQQINLGPLFLKGYSEGGYATMALQKALETNYKNEFKIAASAPAGGPYNLSITSNILLQKPTNNPVNVPFLVLSYHSWLTPNDFDLSKVLPQEPQTLMRLFGGAYRNEDIYKALPAATNELFKPDLVDDFLSSAPTLKESQKIHAWLDQQSLHNKAWAPSSPTRLYHCKDDDTVPVEAALTAIDSFKAINPNAPVAAIVIPSPAPDTLYKHGNCPAVFAALQWFGEILAAPQTPK